jgi:outer membrane protein OmpA-like peptidoglycan-associated protein
VVLRVHGIAFGVGSAQVRAGQDDLVARLADAIALFPGAAVRVEGHTDDTGGRDANLRLSRRRAETVAVLLADRLGRAAESLATDGFGPDRPVALNSTPEGRALNRRIDVVIAPGF